MAGLVKLIVFYLLLFFFYYEGYFALFDPTAADSDKSYVKTMLALVMAVSTGLVAAWAFRQNLWLGPTFIGTGIGYFATVYLLILVDDLGTILMSTNPMGAQKVDLLGPQVSLHVTLLGALFGTVAGYYLKNVVLLSTQSFFSAYMITRGLSLWVPRFAFPSEFSLMKQVYASQEDSQKLSVPVTFYAYIAMIVVCYVFFFRF